MASDTSVKAIKAGVGQRRFFYNRAVNNVNVTEIHNVYNTTVVNNAAVTRVSYNGGSAASMRGRGAKRRVAHERHILPVQLKPTPAGGASNPEQRLPQIEASHQSQRLRGPEISAVALSSLRETPALPTIRNAIARSAAPVKPPG